MILIGRAELRWSMHVAVVLLALQLLGCSSGQEMPPPIADTVIATTDQGVVGDAVTPLLDAGAPDAYPPPLDSAPPKLDQGCQLGTPAACASCTDDCPGPKSGSHTARVCIAAKCDIQCKGEYYDVNGKVQDGCEFIDDLPIHDLESSAASMGSVSDCAGLQTTSAVIPSDARLHILAPTSRPNGRADVFKLSISDDWGCRVDAKVEVSFSALPAASRFLVSTYYRCRGGKTLASKSSAASGGSAVTLSPSVRCTTGSLGNDSGTVYVEVKKQSGAHDMGSYQVTITP